MADRGFRRAAGFLRWLEYRNLDYVVRLSKGSCITETDGSRWKLGEERLRPGGMRFHKGACVTGSTTEGPGSSSSTRGALLEVAGGCPRAGRGTPEASSNPLSRGISGNQPEGRE